MCTVSIHIDEEAIRKHNPALSTKELIQQWLQRQVDFMMEDFTTRAQQPPCCYSEEEARDLITERLDRLDSGNCKTVSLEDVQQRMQDILS